MENIILLILLFGFILAEVIFQGAIPIIFMWTWPIVAGFTVSYVLIRFDFITISMVFLILGFIGEIIWVIYYKNKKSKLKNSV